MQFAIVCHALPPSSCGFMMVKLKWKIEFKGHCYFQAVRPTQVLYALTKLKEINSLYQSIDINGSINDTFQIQDSGLNLKVLAKIVSIKSLLLMIV